MTANMAAPRIEGVGLPNSTVAMVKPLAAGSR